MTTEDKQPIDYQSLVDDIRHELGKVYNLKMNPAFVFDAIDIIIHEQTGLDCVADSTKGCNPETKGLHIDPPPEEDLLYRVIYVIDIGASDSKAAANEAYETMIDPDSIPPVLYVIDPTGSQLTIDLSQDEERR